MVRGLYTAYTGMLNQQYRLDTITNNLANATTTGYKREGATSRAFDDVLAIKVKDSSVGYINQNIGKMSLGVKIGENYVDYSQGSLVETENTYDLALEGNGFFSILFTNKNGEDVVKYTRDGSFVTDAEGTLRTKDGDYVLNDAGTEIVVPTDAEEVLVDELGYKGYTEASNINVVSEMVEMIEIARAYESNQKAVKTMDEMMSKSVNNVGKLG